MSLREDLLPVCRDARALVESLGLRTNSLTIRTRTYSGEPGVWPYSDLDLVITPRPKMRWLTGAEVAASGGRYAEGDMKVTKITPAYAGGGYTPEQLRPAPTEDNVEILYVVTGPEAGEYRLVDDSFDRNFGYELVIRLQRSTP